MVVYHQFCCFFFIIIIGTIWESEFFQRHAFPEKYWSEKVQFYELERERIKRLFERSREPKTWKEIRDEREEDEILKSIMTRDEYDNYKNKMTKFSSRLNQMFSREAEKRALEKNKKLLEQARNELPKPK